MAFVDDLYRILRDHIGYAGDGQGGVGALPVGDRNTARNQIDLRDLREILLLMAQTMGDPSALQDILDELGIKADATALAATIASSTITLTNIGGTANAITASLPAGLGLTAVPVGMPLALRAVGVNTGPVTLSVAGGPALPLRDGRGRDLAAGDLTGGTPLLVRPSFTGLTEYRIASSLVHPADMLAEASARSAQDVLIGGILAPAQDRTASVIDIPPVALGSRLMQPETLSFDLAVERGYWLDNGLPWLPDGRMADLFEVTELDGITVTEWSFDLRPLRGYVTATGEAWPEGSAVAGLPQMQIEVVSPTLIYAYVRQFGSTYVRWALHHDTVPARNADIWRIGACFRVERAGSAYVPVRSITFGGETDVAILLRQSVGGGNKADHIGGNVHGNEELTEVTLLINGVVFDPLTAPVGIRDAHEIEVLQASNMFEPGNTSGTIFVPKGPLIMRHYKRIRLANDGWWDQWSFVDHIIDGFEVRNAYFGMVCLEWGTRGHNSVHTAAREPFWLREDVSVSDFPMINSVADTLKAWGNDYAAEVQILDGWTSPGRFITVDNRPDRRKIYSNFARGDITSSDEPWDVHIRYCITIKETI